MSVTIQVKPHDHVVQFYEDDARLTNVVADYFRAGADAGERLVALLTPCHRESLLKQLTADGMDTSSLISEGQLVILDAHSILERIMRNGVPVYSLFQQHLLAHIIEESPFQPVRAFGELVNLLCADGNPAAAIQLEAFWHEACERLQLTLLCGYDLYAFHQDGGQQAYAAICDHHSHVLPAEAYAPRPDKHPIKGILPSNQQPDGGQPKAEPQIQDKRAQATCNQILEQLTSTTSIERTALRAALATALSRGEMVLHFQPVVCAQTRQVVGVSVVPFWHSGRFGVMPPSRWMAAAREAGQSAAISRWLLAGACREAMAWYVVPGSGLRMTVPISADDLISTDLIARVDEALSVSGLPGELLELEVSEDSLARLPRQAEGVVIGLKARGVCLAVAGVASATSTLRHFSRYSMDTLRISGTIIDGCLDNRHHQITIESMIVMAHQLGLSVTAGNVSSREQASYLRELGCDTLQGRLWARMEYCEPELETVAPALSDTDLFSGMESDESPVTDWKEGHDLLSAIMDTTLDGLGVLESVRNEGGNITDFHIRKCNHRMCEIVKNSASNLIGKHLLDIHPGVKEEGIFRAYSAVVETGTPLQMETHYQHEGMDLSLRITAARLGDGVLVTMTDISAFKQREQVLRDKRLAAEHAALHDPLTGLPNRSYLARKLEALANDTNRDWYALAYIDLDNFKVLNDTQGHQAGDLALETFATTLNSHLRDDDFVARVGGDEFVAVLRLESANETQAHQLTCRVIDAVRTVLPEPLGASFGIHIWQATEEDSREALFMADRTMYECKLRRRSSD